MQVNLGLSISLKWQQQSRRDLKQHRTWAFTVARQEGAGGFQSCIVTDLELAQTLVRSIWTELIDYLGSGELQLFSLSMRTPRVVSF